MRNNVYNKVKNLDIYLNFGILHPVKLPNPVIISYSLLLAYFPFTEKKKTNYLKLENRQKAGFLFRYLIKCAYQTNTSQPLIDDLINTKKLYDSVQKEYNNEKLDNAEVLIAKMKKNTLNEMCGNIEILLEKSNCKKVFEDKMILMINTICYNSNNINERKMKIEKIFGDK
jgi:hypothetical protein